MFESFIDASSREYGVPVSWIQAVIQTESSWNPNAYNASDPGGARGLMQIIAATARAYGVTNLSDLFDPATNIDIGTHLLSDIAQGLHVINWDSADFRRVYSAYNSGNPDKWETSSQVAANVQRALGALANWTTSNPGTSSGIGLLLVGVVIWKVFFRS